LFSTTFDYPTKWELTVPGADLKLTLEAPFPDQEFITLIARPAFWEGRLEVTGTYKGKKITGVGFIERHGFEGLDSLDVFFKKISKSVLEQVEILLPLKPNHEQVRLPSSSFFVCSSLLLRPAHSRLLLVSNSNVSR
jgi:hypothetical protein